jgi:hypothetical protein
MDPKKPPDQAALIKETGAVSPRRNETTLAHAKGKLRSHRQER